MSAQALTYRREIDGLRAVAVIPVVLFHAGFSLFSGGFIGVDVFFVISGYLITSIIIAELSVDQFSILAFYERRARRILPALFTVMLVCIPFAWILMLPAQLVDFSKSLAAVTLFVSNILFWQESGYFSPAAELKPLLHTWSLAIEEQFYIFFPPILALVWRFNRNWVMPLIMITATASLVLAEIASHRAPSVNYYFLPTRAWELLIGSLCALRPAWHRPSHILSGLGLVAIIIASIAFDQKTPFPGVAAMLPVFGTALIIVFAQPGTIVARVLSLPVIVGIGLLSFSIYLWHQPLFAFARIYFVAEPPRSVMVALAIASLALASLSWKYIETPFRRRDTRWLDRRGSVFLASAASGGTLIALSIAIVISEGLPNRFTPIQAITRGEWRLPELDAGGCFYSVDKRSELVVGDQGHHCVLGDIQAQRRVLVFGDSFAGQYDPLFDSLGQAKALRVDSVTTNWCLPIFDTEFGFQRPRARAQCLSNREWVQGRLTDYDTIILGGQWNRALGAGRMAAFEASVSTILAQSNANIVILPAAPPFERLSVEYAAWRGQGVLVTDSEATEQIHMAHTKLAAIAARSVRVHFITPKALFGPEVATGRLTQGDPFSVDGAHISLFGARMLARRLEAQAFAPLLSAMSNTFKN